jgi:hypothetical protein
MESKSIKLIEWENELIKSYYKHIIHPELFIQRHSYLFMNYTSKMFDECIYSLYENKLYHFHNRVRSEEGIEILVEAIN